MEKKYEIKIKYCIPHNYLLIYIYFNDGLFRVLKFVWFSLREYETTLYCKVTKDLLYISRAVPIYILITVQNVISSFSVCFKCQ